jgi:hypothetical protein
VRLRRSAAAMGFTEGVLYPAVLGVSGERWNRCRQLNRCALWPLVGASQATRKFVSPSSPPFWLERSRHIVNSTMASQFEFRHAIEALQKPKAGEPRL